MTYHASVRGSAGLLRFQVPSKRSRALKSLGAEMGCWSKYISDIGKEDESSWEIVYFSVT